VWAECGQVAIYDLRVRRPLNDAQLTMLRWVGGGHVPAEATNSQRLTARALHNRGLVQVKGHGAQWTASVTPAGEYFLRFGTYPPSSEDRQGDKASWVEDAKSDAPTSAPPPAPDLTVDSPRGTRGRGLRPRGDALFSASDPDPYDEKILITVKEAAWMLALPEGAIRRAVVAGDLDRVFFGDGERNYRIVYGSLLAWVNDMPRESAHSQWWGRR